jgi:hypothetical protein
VVWVFIRKDIVKERKYTITAIPITTSRFGPSGSLKKRNITREHMRDVRPRVSNEVFFDLKYIPVIIFSLRILFAIPVPVRSLSLTRIKENHQSHKGW